MNSSVILAAAISVPLTVLVALCIACRRCKKRGKGTMVGNTNKSKFKDWNVGDILGRNKDGFQPVNTDERDGMLDDDSDSEVGAINTGCPKPSTKVLIDAGFHT